MLKQKNIKVTLALTEESLEFFKEEAERHHVDYQQMIRILLDKCAAHH